MALRQASLRVPIPNHHAFGAGFPEFTRFFNHSFLWKLQFGMNFPVAVRTQQDALVEFLAHLFPTTGVALAGNSEVFA